MQCPMDIRAELLERSLDAGLPPYQAVDAASRMWRFVRDGDGDGRGDATVVGVRFIKSLGTWDRINAEGCQFEPTDGFFDRHPIWGSIRQVTVDGQAMVRIPAFYWKREETEGELRLWVSDVPAEGFQRHPAFRLDGRDIPAVEVGAYQACLDGSVAGSRAGTDPLTQVDFSQMQHYCARGNGFGLWSIYELGAIKLLALIELGTPDNQNAIGFGNCRGGRPQPAGSTVANWRGLNELWGNVWQMVDGLRHDDEGRAVIWDTQGRQQWIETGVRSPVANGLGWIDGFHGAGNSDWDLGAAFLPNAVTSDRESAAGPDYYIAPDIGHASVTYHGGDWSHGSEAGLFMLYCNSPASVTHTHLGGRLARRVLSPET